MHVGKDNPRWREKRSQHSRHSRHMHNPQFCVSGERPMNSIVNIEPFIQNQLHIVHSSGSIMVYFVVVRYASITPISSRVTSQFLSSLYTLPNRTEATLKNLDNCINSIQFGAIHFSPNRRINSLSTFFDILNFIFSTNWLTKYIRVKGKKIEFLLIIFSFWTTRKIELSSNQHWFT